MDKIFVQDGEDAFVDYKRCVREKASGSIHELQHALDSDPVILPEDRLLHKLMVSDSKETISNGTTEHSDYSYSVAANRLRNMLNRFSPNEQRPRPVTPKTILFDLPPREVIPTTSAKKELHPAVPPVVFRYSSPGDIPTPEEFIKLLQNEAAQIQHLEAEKKYLNEELSVLKLKVMEITEENRILHEELRSSVVHELVTGGISPSIISVKQSDLQALSHLGLANDADRKLGKFDYEKWQMELEKVRSCHLAKSARLETQLQFAKEEIQTYETEIDELRKQLRMMESLRLTEPSAGITTGLCIKCAVNQAVLPPSVDQLQKQNIDSLMRERDDLMAHLTLLRTRYEEIKNKEEDLYLQVKACSDMVEQSQMEMTQVLIEREQFKDELMNAKRRLEEQIQLNSQRTAEECELVRKEGQAARDDLNNKNKELLEKLSETQILLDKTTREKMSALAELDIVKGQLSRNDMDYCQATENLKVNFTQATLDRNLAMQQVERMKQELDQADKDRHAERLRLKQEMEDVRRRLHQAEKELLISKEECIALHNNNQALEREVHLIKLSKESLQRGLNDDLVSADKRSELREIELNATIDNLQKKQARTVEELEEYSKSQMSIIHKLREECRLLVKKLEDVTHKHKEEKLKMKTHNEQLSRRLERTLPRCKELQEQHSQQSILQEKMRERLQEMDKFAQHSSQQVQDLLAKESILMRERRELGQHVEFLLRELMSCDKPDKLNVYFSEKGYVQGILKNIRNEETKYNKLSGGDNDIKEDIVCQDS